MSLEPVKGAVKHEPISKPLLDVSVQTLLYYTGLVTAQVQVNNFKQITFLILLSCACFLPLKLAAQDTTPPTIVFASTDVVPNGSRQDFIFNVIANDDIAISGLQYRARVNGHPFESFQSFPYVPGFPLVFSVQCNFFALEIRAVDTSGNFSATITKSFRAPFTGSPGTPLTDGFVIQDPPQVVQAANKKTTVIMKKFRAPKGIGKSAQAVGLRAAYAAKKKPAPKVIYETTFTNQGTQQISRYTTKRNILSTKLAGGTYTVSYNARVQKGQTVLSQTAQSPEALFIAPD